MSAPTHALVFGATGQLGARLITALDAAGYEVTGIDRARCDFLTTDEKQLATIIRAVEPSIILNAAAYTNVDGAETEGGQAMRANAEIPGLLARLAHAQQIPLLHFSTDYVFSGGHAPYAAEATTHPLNAYGASKRAGEEAVRAAGATVFRLQWVYDTRGKNFFLTMKKILSEREEVRVVADQLGAPSSARDIAAAVVKTVPLIIEKKLPADIYHLTASSFTSWHGFACAIAELTGGAARIFPITTAEYPRAATSPGDTRLDCSPLAAYGIAMPHWRDGLNALLKESHENP